MKRDDDEPREAANKPAEDGAAPSGRRRRGRPITAKDAGWISPTAFVAPITLVPIDPPQPLNRRRPEGE